MIPDAEAHTIRTSGQGRRRFLRRTLGGSLFLALARLPLFASQDQSPADESQFFDAAEFSLFTAIAGRIVAPIPKDAPAPREVARRADAFLALEHPEIQEQYHLLLTLFNSPWIAFLFDLRFSSFVDMTPAQQDTFLDDWMRSPLGFRRTAFQALKRLSLSMYYTHPGSWQSIGFDGDYSAT